MFYSTPQWKFVTSTICRVEKGCALSNLAEFLTQFMDQAKQTIGPDSFDSVGSMIACADRVGKATLKDLSAWERKRAVVIQMPKRRRRAKR
jgi:hypothetical protein